MGATVYPDAIQEPGTDCGLFVGGPARGVLHTTEGGSYAGALAAFRASNIWPHFTVTFEDNKFTCYQHIPIDRAATALEHRPGTVETNRQHAIQIEIVWFAKDAPNMPTEYLAGIAKLMRWIEENDGVRPLASSTWSGEPIRWTPYPESAGDNNGIRFSDEDWLAHNGWCGHMHVPHQEHGDPGVIRIAELLCLAEHGDTIAKPSATPQAQQHAVPAGNAHVMISHAARTAKAFSPSGVLLWTVEVLTTGANGGQSVRGGDTPFGTYTTTGKIVPTLPADNWETHAEYGPLFIELQPGPDVTARQEQGIGWHGGRQGQYAFNPAAPNKLWPTYGCIRGHDNDLTNIVAPLVRATHAAGHHVEITVGA